MTTVSRIAPLAPCGGPRAGAACPQAGWVDARYSQRCPACTRRRVVPHHFLNVNGAALARKEARHGR